MNGGLCGQCSLLDVLEGNPVRQKEVLACSQCADCGTVATDSKTFPDSKCPDCLKADIEEEQAMECVRIANEVRSGAWEARQGTSL
ncbi:hypothetical protein K435DRAFT_855894 [Dendrothele bispora CBS 962.96]|uniref:Uncharacterized protein n=1 Tax=Dendrothele bispora (strain CBS 962.96) TaxID=1314807 RepID=A0A4S8LLX1_DENBC|nr:hypothetical protein K435DRAFT_864422 [Dendrothele bispora CBS 962.96]THU99216.1 hypothetical protein K435DRAFT_855894 [Dendrothele bispora CBS 962.96]